MSHPDRNFEIFHMVTLQEPRQEFQVQAIPDDRPGLVNLVPIGGQSPIFIATETDLQRGQDMWNTYQKLQPEPLADLTVPPNHGNMHPRVG